MGSTNKNPDGVDTDLATREQLQSYTRAEADLAQLRIPVLLHADSPHERLYIAAQDGTGNSLRKDAPENQSIVARVHAQIRDLKNYGAANRDSITIRPAAQHRQPFRRRPPWVAALVTSLALTGCQSAMTNPANTPAPSDTESSSSKRAPSAGVVAEWPLRFFWHNFGTSCYSVYGCNIKYGHYWREEPDDELKLSSASIGDKYPKNLSASYGPIRNFPPPAIVRWRSRDGTALRAELDMAEIFKDQLVLHNLRREEVLATGSVADPQIILEVNDRTINVYMRAFISTKDAQIPGNKYSFSRNDLVRAFSRTY